MYNNFEQNTDNAMFFEVGFGNAASSLISWFASNENGSSVTINQPIIGTDGNSKAIGESCGFDVSTKTNSNGMIVILPDGTVSSQNAKDLSTENYLRYKGFGKDNVPYIYITSPEAKLQKGSYYKIPTEWDVTVSWVSRGITGGVTLSYANFIYPSWMPVEVIKTGLPAEGSLNLTTTSSTKSLKFHVESETNSSIWDWNRNILKPEVGFIFEDMYSLAVNNGAGSGNFAAGSVKTVTAKDSAGYAFEAWTGDTEYLNSTTSKSALVTMPAKDIAVTATYTQAITYQLTVTNGSNSGEYAEGEIVTIIAKDSSGYTFERWTGDISYLANVYSKTTTLTMPETKIAIAAEYSKNIVTIDTINPSSNLIEWCNLGVVIDGYGSTVDTASALINDGVAKASFDIVASNADAKEYAYGSLDFRTPGTHNTLEQVNYIKVTYKTDDAFKLVLPQKGLADQGASYETNLDSTDGEFKTIIIAVEVLQQPNWVTTVTDYNALEVKSVSFAMQKDNSTGSIEIKEIVLYDYRGDETALRSRIDPGTVSVNAIAQNRTLKLSVPHQLSATVSLFSASGRLVMKRENVHFSAGENSVELRSVVAKGLYFLTISGKQITHTQKLLLK